MLQERRGLYQRRRVSALWMRNVHQKGPDTGADSLQNGTTSRRCRLTLKERRGEWTSERIAGTITMGGEVVIGDVTAVPSVAALPGAISRCSHAALYSAVEVTDYAVVFYQICIVKAHPWM